MEVLVFIGIAALLIALAVAYASGRRAASDEGPPDPFERTMPLPSADIDITEHVGGLPAPARPAEVVRVEGKVEVQHVAVPKGRLSAKPAPPAKGSSYYDDVYGPCRDSDHDGVPDRDDPTPFGE